MTGALFMGVGGVMAGGCTVGAGLGGAPTLGLSALIALGAIVVGAAAMQLGLRVLGRGAGLAGVPAE